MTLWRPCLIGVMLLVAACRPTGQRLQAPGVVPGGVPPTPEHTLTAGDVFEIRLPFAADYNDRVTVGMDGTVAPKAIGSVQIGGLTVPEATERLKASYAKLLKAPDLSITVRRFAPEIIYVDGWVNRPGLIRSDIPLTLERALAQAGGVKTGAKTSDILIMRHDAGSTVRTYTAKAGPSLGGISGGPNLDDPLLKSFDVVYVPQTAVAAASSFAQQYYANVPFSASFHVPATQVPSIVTPQVINPPTPALPVIAPQ